MYMYIIDSKVLGQCVDAHAGLGLDCICLKIQVSFCLGNIGLDKTGYQVSTFLISKRKHMLWVLIRSASQRRF